MVTYKCWSRPVVLKLHQAQEFSKCQFLYSTCMHPEILVSRVWQWFLRLAVLRRILCENLVKMCMYIGFCFYMKQIIYSLETPDPLSGWAALWLKVGLWGQVLGCEAYVYLRIHEVLGRLLSLSAACVGGGRWKELTLAKHLEFVPVSIRQYHYPSVQINKDWREYCKPWTKKVTSKSFSFKAWISPNTSNGRGKCNRFIYAKFPTSHISLPCFQY